MQFKILYMYNYTIQFVQHCLFLNSFTKDLPPFYGLRMFWPDLNFYVYFTIHLLLTKSRLFFVLTSINRLSAHRFTITILTQTHNNNIRLLYLYIKKKLDNATEKIIKSFFFVMHRPKHKLTWTTGHCILFFRFLF